MRAGKKTTLTQVAHFEFIVDTLPYDIFVQIITSLRARFVKADLKIYAKIEG